MTITRIDGSGRTTVFLKIIVVAILIIIYSCIYIIIILYNKIVNVMFNIGLQFNN